MRNIVLYIAMSIDGYIADRSGGIGWLTDQNGDSENMGSYPGFIQSVDTVLMGYTTYHQITAELAPGNWPYAGMQTYVLTHRALEAGAEITFTAEAPTALVQRLRRAEGRDIWLCGGADVARQFLLAGLIDRFHLTVIPTLLGGGVRLFAPDFPERRLELLSTAVYGGMTDLVYASR